MWDEQGGEWAPSEAIREALIGWPRGLAGVVRDYACDFLVDATPTWGVPMTLDEFDRGLAVSLVTLLAARASQEDGEVTRLVVSLGQPAHNENPVCARVLCTPAELTKEYVCRVGVVVLIARGWRLSVHTRLIGSLHT